MPKITEKLILYPITQENVLCVISKLQIATKDEILLLLVMKYGKFPRYLARLDTILGQLLRKERILKLPSDNPSEESYRIA